MVLPEVRGLVPAALVVVWFLLAIIGRFEVELLARPLAVPWSCSERAEEGGGSTSCSIDRHGGERRAGDVGSLVVPV